MLWLTDKPAHEQPYFNIQCIIQLLQATAVTPVE